MATDSPPGTPTRIADLSSIGHTAPATHTFNDRPIRGCAVRAVLPGLDDQAHRLDPETSLALTTVLSEGLHSVPHVDEVELLTITGDRQLETFVIPRLSKTDPALLETPVPDASAPFEQRDPLVPSSTREALAELVASALPEAIGVEICDVDLSGIRSWPVTTGRALLGTNRSVRQPHTMLGNPFVETVKALNATGHPFAVQAIIGTGRSASYVATVRYAAFHPEYSVATDLDRLEHLKFGLQPRIDPIMHQAGLETNFDLPIGDFAQAGATAPRLKKRNYMELSDSAVALGLYTGETEYRDLLAGHAGTSYLYDKLKRHGRIPMDEFHLRLIGHLVPLYFPTSPWNGVPGRSGPRINTRAVFRHAPGTDHSPGLTMDTTGMAGDSGLVQTSGSVGHNEQLAHAVTYFRGIGDEAWVNEQDTSSMPDGGRQPSEARERAIESVWKSQSKPSKPAVNKSRAMTTDQPVDFIVKDRKAATKLFELLQEPWKSITDNGVHLLNLTTPVILENGQRPLLPADIEEAEWYLRYPKELSLRDGDGRVLARGQADESVRTFDYDMPRYEERDGTHCVVTPDGGVLATYDSRKAMSKEWTSLYAPFVPMALQLLTDVTIHTPAGDELTAFDCQADWDVTAEQSTPRFAAGIERFVERYMVEAPGESMLYSEFQAAVQSYFEARSTDTPPNKTHIGRNLPDTIDVDPPDVSERHVNDRTLLFQPGIISPDLPFVTDDEGDDDPVDDEEDT